MPLGSLLDELPGESVFINILSTDEGGETTALLHPVGEVGRPVRCTLVVSNYRISIRDFGLENFSFPLMSIDSWSVPRVTMTATHRAVFLQGGGQPILPSSTPPSPAPSGPNAANGLPPSLQNSSNTPVYALKISSKHLWEVEVLLRGDRTANTISKLRKLSHVAHIKGMPAFSIYKERYPNGEVMKTTSVNCEDLAEHVEFGWNLYTPARELERQLCQHPGAELPEASDTQRAGTQRDLRPWFRLSCVKQPYNSYGKSPTYPFQIVVPNAASDDLIEYSMAARSRARVPAISFVHFGTGAVLARGSQPLTRSPMLRRDGELCYLFVNSGYHEHNAQPVNRDTATIPTNKVVPPPSLFDTSSMPQQRMPSNTRNQRTLFVLDCRPSAAAIANGTLGGGFEGGATHDFCEVKFQHIDNIYGVSKSFAKLKTLVQQFNGKEPKDNFLSQLHDTKWLYHIQRVLMCSTEIAELLDRGDSCLVHCTDGWDRTSQSTATAMMLLDPFYRTIVGFCVLAEKEFASFGHKFAERGGHQVRGDTRYPHKPGVGGSDTEGEKLQPSPIFVQWMDVVYQVVRQFPQHFEFTPRLLEFLSEEVYSCLYGTFLGNCEKERMFEGVRLRTGSIWTDIVRLATLERKGEAPLYFVNDMYDSETAWEYISKQKGCGIYRLAPSCSSKRLAFWESFYLRHDGDNYSLGIQNSYPKMQKKLNFSEEWLRYFDNFIKESCVARQKEVVEMEDLLQNLDVNFSDVSIKMTKDDSKSCSECHKKFGVLSSRDKCHYCNDTFCSDCTVRLEKGLKVCRGCHKDHEWDKK